MRTTLRGALALGLVAASSLLAGCDDGPSGVDDGVGTLSFDLVGGGITRDFSARGRLSVAGTGGSSYAGAIRDGEGYLIVAFDRAAGTEGDLSFLFLPAVTTGSELTFDADLCTPVPGENESECAFSLSILDTDLTDTGETPGETALAMIDGTLRITSVTTTEIRGTFSGLAVVEGTETDPNPEFVDVEDGSFALPVFEDENPDFAARVRSLPR
jgi:hypothetical protein